MKLVYLLSGCRQSRFLLALIISIFSANAIADGKYDVTSVKNYSTEFKSNQPIDVNLDVSGVKLDSVFFEAKNLQAFVILRNRTPVSVNPTVGVSLFDSQNKLIATGIDTTDFSFTGDSISAGEQKNIKLSFDRFINDYKEVASFKLVYSLGAERATTSSGSSSRDEDF